MKFTLTQEALSFGCIRGFRAMKQRYSQYNTLIFKGSYPIRNHLNNYIYPLVNLQLLSCSRQHVDLARRIRR